MKKLLIFTVLLFTTSANADMQIARTNPYIAGGNYSAAAPSYIFDETFGGSTLCYTGLAEVCDNAWTYASSATFAEGTLTIPVNYAYVCQDFSGVGTVYAGVKMNWADGTNRIIVELKKADGTTLAMALIYENVLYVLNTDGTNQSATGSLTAGNDYYIKLYAKSGTGLNAEARAAYSTNGTDWTWTTLSNDGNWTDDVGRLQLSNLEGTKSQMVYKLVRISETDFNF